MVNIQYIYVHMDMFSEVAFIVKQPKPFYFLLYKQPKFNVNTMAPKR